ncbi:hypothetical protein [Aquimarina pacifica]|uniref:hypothetical protein n=1 Tax=Aquimarina pacifica TaxID=1296415 RepID=UPI0004706760|nr:hypothetical protein [Aquimarina pacifica]
MIKADSKQRVDFDSQKLIQEIQHPQNYLGYTLEEKESWKTLVERQNKVSSEYSCNEIKKGIASLGINSLSIANVALLSDKLYIKTGWNLVPITGLLPEDVYLKLLTIKKFPVSVEIRSKEEIDFSDTPDLFHDTYGHIPILFNPDIRNFLNRFGQIALNYLDNKKALMYLTKIYWFTMETGIIEEDGELKVFGASVLTSSNESKNIYNNENITLHKFDLDKIMNSDYHITSLQKEYYVIDSFKQLTEINEHLESRLDELI